MVNRQYLFRVLIACAVCLALPPVASVQADAEADNREVASYRLSDAALARYADATRRFSDVFAENPPPCAESADNSLSGMAARIDAIPGASAALSAAGMGSREYIVFGLATFQAGMGAWALTEGGGELPPGVSPENVEFYQAHETEIQALSGLLPENDCQGGEEEGDWEDDGSEYDG
ncbi:MAG: hypothetical protein EHM68_12935 [Lysobacterales bacterium]|jgi:hypothetical protein|nr:MAG: hypothetical protein EHM68_12935 [Xanthomonadales bacterium]